MGKVKTIEKQKSSNFKMSCVVSLILLFSIVKPGVHGRTIAQQPPLAPKTHLGRKYICVNFYEQPAFDHPLLKHLAHQAKPNHTSSTQVNLNDVDNGCPDGTVPILSSMGDDLPTPADPTTKDHCRAIVQTTSEDMNTEFYGANGSPSLNKPKAEGYQWSAARIKLSHGTESIEAGWMVYPDYFKDNEAHLYTMIKIGNDECLNTDCPGFVQVSPNIALGAIPEYTIARVTMFWNITILKDQDKDDWYLWVGKPGFNQETVGYWPNTLFVELRENATQIEWGGEINNPSAVEPAPSMGSGFKAEKNEELELGRPAYFQHLTVVDHNLADVKPRDLQEITDCEDLYNLRQDWENNRFFYGGYYDY